MTAFLPFLGIITAALPREGPAVEYDPLTLFPGAISTLDLMVHDERRQREIPVRIYLPARPIAAPVVVFSHGMGGSKEGSPFLGEHWARRGYAAVFLQHAGSDEWVWKNQPPRERLKAMEFAASAENLLLRALDVPAVLDQLERWNEEAHSPLAGRLDLKKVGMSGHSFGAATTQAVSGETLPFPGRTLTDARIKAAISCSPGTPERTDASTAFGSVAIPWMLLTGTKDLAPIGRTDMASRLAVYPALRHAPKYELVLFNAEHSVFIERALPGERGPRNPNHRRVILALTAAFWDAHLGGDSAALGWLTGTGPRTVMEPEDKWSFAK